MARGFVLQPSGGVALKLMGAGGVTGARLRLETPIVATAAITAAPATSHAMRSRDRRCGATDIGTVPPVDGVSRASIANARSSADWNRAFGSFSVQRRMMRVRAGGTCRDESGASARSSFRIAVIVSGAVSREKARAPVTIS